GHDKTECAVTIIQNRRSRSNGMGGHDRAEYAAVEYPVGHRRRREEGVPLLVDKFERHLATRFPSSHSQKIAELCSHQTVLEAVPVHKFMDLWMI
ncbi:2-methylcitrate dehydratase, partial [Halomonas sp. NPDC076908]